MDYLEFEVTPSEENCVQVGSEDYIQNALIEYETMKNQLIRTFGEPPKGTFFKKHFADHDFGRYIELYLYYDSNDEISINYAFEIDNNWPKKWDEQSIRELKNKEYNGIH